MDLEAWIKTIPWMRVVLSAAIIAGAIVAWRLLRITLQKWQKKRDHGGLKGTGATAVTMLYGIARAVLIAIVVLWVLQINGVNVTSMVAGLGIVGAGVVLAFQDYLKDIIMGVHIMTDDFFKVGDVIEYNGTEGQVIAFNLRCTKIRALDDASILTISNRNIADMKKRSNLILLNVPLPYEADFRKVHDVLRKIAARIAREDKVLRCEYKGTQLFGDSAVVYRLNLFCLPEHKWHAWRAAMKLLQEGLDEADLHIPYQQIDVHNIPVQ